VFVEKQGKASAKQEFSRGVSAITTSKLAVYIISCLIFLVMVIPFYGHIVDDAYITFRYAKNFVDGHGLVFNPGEKVEGYTNFSWVILSALSLLVSVSPELLTRIIGLLCCLGTIAVVVHFSPADKRFPQLLWMPSLFLAANPPFAVWATGGMETPLFAFLVTLGVLLAAEGVQKERLPLSSALLLGLAALTRPEGVLVAAIISGSGFIINLKSSSFRRNWVRWNIVFAAIFLPYFMWRLSYYGFLFPNSFYAKVDPGGSQLDRGFFYSHEFLKVTGYWLLGAFVGFWWAKRRKFIMMLFSFIIIFTLYIVYVGGDGLPMFRFFAPLVGLFFLLIATCLYGVFEKIQKWKPGKIVITALLAAAWLFSMSHAFRGPAFDYVLQDIYEVSSWKRIGLWFKEHADAGDSIAVIPAGAIPYFSELTTIDMLGINDLTIGHKATPEMGKVQAGHEKHDSEYVLSRKPTYVIIGIYGLESELLPPKQVIKPFYPAEKELLRSSEFKQQYKLASAKAEGGYFYFFVSADKVQTRLALFVFAQGSLF